MQGFLNLGETNWKGEITKRRTTNTKREHQRCFTVLRTAAKLSKLNPTTMQTNDFGNN